MHEARATVIEQEREWLAQELANLRFEIEALTRAVRAMREDLAAICDHLCLPVANPIRE